MLGRGLAVLDLPSGFPFEQELLLVLPACGGLGVTGLRSPSLVGGVAVRPEFRLVLAAIVVHLVLP